MATARYRATLNGFKVVHETWDDALNRDGQHDEVFFQSIAKKTRKDGTVIYNGESSTKTTATMGDISSPGTLGRRIKAGNAERPIWQGGGAEGGLMNGDVFPEPDPTKPPLPHEMSNDYPPCLIWEDTIADDEVVHIIPTIWEWDDTSFLNGVIETLVKTDKAFGDRAKKVFGPISGPYEWIFEAVSLGIETLGSFTGLFNAAGEPATRPIGIKRDPNNPDVGVFTPMTIELTRASADALIAANPSGDGLGVLSIKYIDDVYLWGHYILYVQITKLVDSPTPPNNQLRTGQSLRRDGRLTSANGRFTLWMQPDGNLVLYDGVPAVQTAYWATHTSRFDERRRPTHVDMQADGHLVTYNDDMWPSWGTGVYGPTYVNPYLELMDNGNLVIFENGRNAIWSTNTARP
jgi:hypothetical protein